jgi:hypothetical protein
MGTWDYTTTETGVWDSLNRFFTPADDDVHQIYVLAKDRHPGRTRGGADFT